MITDVRIAWANEIQDVTDSSTLSFTNNSFVWFDDGTSREAIESDSLIWKWYLINDTTKVELASTFDLAALDIVPYVCSGIFKLRLEATQDSTGYVWGFTAPSKCIYNLSTGQPPNCPALITGIPSSIYNSTKYMQDFARIMQFGLTAHRKGEHLCGFKPGDVDKNGVVNIADILLTTTNFGN